MDSDRIKSWVSAGVVALVIGGIVLALRAMLTPPPLPVGDPAPKNNIPSNVALRLQQSEFIGYDGQNRKAWTIHADKVDINSDRSRIEANGNVQAELFDAATGKRRATVNAPFAVFSKLTKSLQVGGKVICRTPGNQKEDDLIVEADTLLWNVGAKQVVCPGSVQATLPNQRGTAAGRDLTLDLPTRAWSLKKFHGEFAVSDNKGSAPPAFSNPFKSIF